MQKFLEERGVPLSLYKHVLLKDIRDKNGYPPVLPEELPKAQPLRDLVQKGGHQDFVLCQGDRILMALEVDGGYHRAPGGEGDGQRGHDESKNRLFREVLGADCFMGNAREGQAADGSIGNAQKRHSFVFIRLPDDGSTCLEAQDLWEAVDPAVRGLYVPLEELLEAQLEKTDGTPAYRIPNRSIAPLASEWDQPDGQGSRPVQANRKLLEEGLITRQQSPVLGKEAVMPTEEGRKAGIIEAVMIDRNGGFYGNALYPESAQGKVLRRLNGYLPLLAGWRSATS